MKRNYLFFIGIMCCVTLFAKQKDEILLTIEDEKISKSEYKYIYEKNNSDNVFDKKTPEEYLDLYVNFKLKVREAIAREINTTQTFYNELAEYRKQFAEAYLTDLQKESEIMQEAYNRLKEDVEVSHILIRVPNNASPADTLAAYKKAQETIKRLEIEDFALVAQEISEDMSVRENKGHIGYITGFWAVYPFETAAYNTPAGKLAPIIRTQFGYHIIKVHNRRPARGEVLTAHIMKMAQDSLAFAEKKEAIDSLYQQLMAGADFETLAKEKSEDFYSAQQGGKLAWFGISRMPIEFENEAFALKNTGDISAPFQTKFGWHIVKLLDKKGVPSFEEKRAEIKRRISLDERAAIIENSFVDKLKNEYKFSLDKKALDEIHNLAKTTQNDTLFREKVAKLNKPLFKYADKIVLQTELSSPELDLYNVDSQLKKLVNKKLIACEDSRLESKYPEFRSQVQEYHDGILMFEISNREVWEKAIEDKEGLEKFFEKNKENYSAENYEDIRGIITSDYQNYLEEEWIKALRAKYKITVNKAVLQSIK